MDGIPALFEAAARLSRPSLVKFTSESREATGSQPTAVDERAKIGLLLREKATHNPNTGSHWSSSLLFSLIEDLARVSAEGLNGPEGEIVLRAQDMNVGD